MRGVLVPSQWGHTWNNRTCPKIQGSGTVPWASCKLRLKKLDTQPLAS